MFSFNSCSTDAFLKKTVTTVFKDLLLFNRENEINRKEINKTLNKIIINVSLRNVKAFGISPFSPPKTVIKFKRL